MGGFKCLNVRWTGGWLVGWFVGWFVGSLCVVSKASQIPGFREGGVEGDATEEGGGSSSRQSK